MKLFYGWVIVAAGIVISCVSFGTAMSLGVFLQPIAQDTGWSRAEIATGAVVTFLAMAAGSLFWGALSDRFGTRAVLLCGGALLGLGLVLASRSESLIAFQLSFGVLSGLAVGSVFAPLTAAASKWFTRHRSLAVALVTAGIGLGSALVAPLARWIITHHDWRTAMFDLGLMAWAVVLPVSLLVRPPPPRDPLDAAGMAEDDKGYSVAQALRSPQFAAIAGTFFACCAAHSGPIFHMISYAIDCGVNAMTAATVLGAAGVASLVGRIVFGLLGDRFGVKPILVGGAAASGVLDPTLPVRPHARVVLRAGGAVRPVLRRGDAAVRGAGAGVFRRPHHGHGVRRRRHGVHDRHGDRAVDRRRGPTTVWAATAGSMSAPAPSAWARR